MCCGLRHCKQMFLALYAMLLLLVVFHAESRFFYSLELASNHSLRSLRAVYNARCGVGDDVSSAGVDVVRVSRFTTLFTKQKSQMGAEAAAR